MLNKIKDNYFISYIYLYIFFMPWNLWNGQMGILTGILLIWWLIVGNKKGYFLKIKDIILFKPLLILLVFLVYTYLSLFWTNNISAAFEETFKYYKYYWILIPILISSVNSKEAKNGIFIFILSIGFYSIFSLLIFTNIISIPFSDSINPRGILAYAIVSPYMAIGFLSSLYIIYYSKIKYIKILFIIIAITCLIALFINRGRAGQVAFMITSFILLYHYRKYFFNLKNIIVLLLFISTLFFTLNETGKLERFKLGFEDLQNMENKGYSGSWAHRIYMNNAGFSILKENFLFGVGAGDHIDEFIEYTKSHPSKATWLRSYHNQHMDMLVKFGLIGYFMFLCSVVVLLRSLYKIKLYYFLALIFFSISLFDGIGDILLYMKPYNNIYMLLFILFSIIAFNTDKNIMKQKL